MKILSYNFTWICVILGCVHPHNNSNLGWSHFTDERTGAGDLPEIIQLEGWLSWELNPNLCDDVFINARISFEEQKNLK